MGRGRAKAKQRKVARQLNYHTPETDFESLQQELSGEAEKDDRYIDRWAHLAEDDPDDDLDDKLEKYKDWK